MPQSVTVVVVPRDRFGSVVKCVEAIVQNTPQANRIAILDFGYSRGTIDRLRRVAAAAPAGPVPIDVVACGRTIPMLAFRDYLPQISTDYVAWVDNDTFVTPGWMDAVLDTAARQGAKVIMPLTLEREGLDRDARHLLARNHISHSELRQVEVGGTRYVLDHKPYRRADPKDIPPGPHRIDFFELHTFVAETAVLRQLDYPAMVVREHIDLGIQLHQLGVDVICDTNARVHFDNIHERPSYADLKFFFFRWDQELIDQSHELFARRWGHRFYNERFLKNWAYRRKVFSVLRFLRLPAGLCDFTSRGMARLFCQPIPAELRADPLARSQRVLPTADSARAGPEQPGRPESVAG